MLSWVVIVSSAAPHVADLIAEQKASLLADFRSQARRQSTVLARLEDGDLENHLPGLTDALVGVMRCGRMGPEKSIQENGTRHGLARRQQGCSVADIVWELKW